MVRALIDGRKTMTRRIAWRAQVSFALLTAVEQSDYRALGWKVERAGDRFKCWRPHPWQKVLPGDRLWVREAWCVSSRHNGTKPSSLKKRSMSVMFGAGGSISNKLDGSWRPDATWPAVELPEWAGFMRPSIHLPRWASRITLVVTATKIEKLQAISEADARDEGLIDGGKSWYGDPQKPVHKCAGAAMAFRDLWTLVHSAESWAANPEVVALTFSVHHCNIDAMGTAA